MIVSLLRGSSHQLRIPQDGCACGWNVKHLWAPEAAEAVELEQACQASGCACTAPDDAKLTTLGLEVS